MRRFVFSPAWPFGLLLLASSLASAAIVEHTFNVNNEFLSSLFCSLILNINLLVTLYAWKIWYRICIFRCNFYIIYYLSFKIVGLWYDICAKYLLFSQYIFFKISAQNIKIINYFLSISWIKIFKNILGFSI